MSQVTVSLGDGATYDIFYEMFKMLAGKAEWQQQFLSAPDGMNISLNDEDVNVVDVTDEGMTVRPTLDDDWKTFGPDRFVSWDDVERIEVF